VAKSTPLTKIKKKNIVFHLMLNTPTWNLSSHSRDGIFHISINIQTWYCFGLHYLCHIQCFNLHCLWSRHHQQLTIEPCQFCMKKNEKFEYIPFKEQLLYNHD